MKTLNISIPEGKTAEWINGVLTLVDENTADKRPIQERVRSYEDALAVLGEDAFPFDKVCPDMTKDEIAYIKLKTIVRSLNEGWVPELKEGEYRYYPWYYLYTQEELDNMEQNEKDKRKLLEFGGLLFGGHANGGTIAGFGCANTDYTPSNTNANVGSRLCLKSDELATYCGKQFIELWFEFLFPEREITKRHL